MKEKVDYKSCLFWILVAISSMSLTFLYVVTDSVIRMVINYMTFVIANKILFKKNILNTFFYTFIALFLFILAEIIYTMTTISIMGITIEEFKEIFFGNVFANAIISLIVLSLVNIKKVINIFSKNNFETHFKTKKTIIGLLVLSILVLAILLYYIYFDVSIMAGLIFNLILVGMYMLIILNLFKEKNDNFKMQVEYKVLIDNLSEYERMLEMQRINNHENKNHMIAVKGMIDSKDKKTREYIDSLINIKYKDDEELLFKTKKLPIGGLQGLIYQKLLIMKEKSINVSLEISKNLDKSLLDKVSTKTNQHICTIVGVELDNAIEAVEDLNEKNIGIHVYNDENNFSITISNNFEGKLELEKIDNKGYTTKGKGHGYGLSLVKQIIEKNNQLTLEREIIGNIFKQKLKTKI
jgi:two-component system sensor histidine kinase AgrC